MSEIKYFKAQIIPSNPDTVVYWAELPDGTAVDVTDDMIPEGSKIEDVTDVRD